jgi:hypothetical protein
VSEVGGYAVVGPTGATYQLPGGIEVQLEPGAELRVLPNVQYLRLGPEGHTRVSTLVLRAGKLVARVTPPAKGRSGLLVATSDHGQLMLTSGEAIVSHDADLHLATLGGQTLRSKKGRWEPVPTGILRTYREDERSTDAPLLSAPRVAARQQMVMAPGRAGSLVGLRWEAVKDARSYEVELRLATGETRRQVEVKPLLSKALTVPAGRHELRVRALGAEGLPGQWSAPVPVRGISVSLPPGGLVQADGSVALGEGQLITFEGAEDLVLSYRGTPKAVPATHPVGLFEGRRTVITLRAPGSLDFALLALEPRRVRAFVNVGPKNATWPKDPVLVSLRLDDGFGRTPEGVEAIPTVTLDGEPIELEWHDTAHGRSASVPPRKECSRCVLRVEVHDQNGVPLGRDFVEIVGTAAPGAKLAHSP